MLSDLASVDIEFDETKERSLKENSKLSKYDWYKDIIFYMQKLLFPPTWDKAKTRSIKIKAVRYCIFGENLFWKDP
jgi:hypothetical protein